MPFKPIARPILAHHFRSGTGRLADDIEMCTRQKYYRCDRIDHDRANPPNPPIPRHPETVEHVIEVPIFRPGHPPLTILGEAAKHPGQPVPKFLVNPPIELTEPRRIKVHSTQIQYTQKVMLNFNGLTWPHVSVATLVPAHAIPLPPGVWD